MTTARVELVFDPTCPNVGQAREAIRAALRALGTPLRWQEWQRDAESTPAALRAYGSPTVLVNGTDVSGGSDAAGADANSCRVYVDDCGCLRGAPSTQQILSAIERSRVDSAGRESQASQEQSGWTCRSGRAAVDGTR